MDHSIFDQLQQLDRQIDATVCEDLGQLEALIAQRSKCCALLQRSTSIGEQDLASLAAMQAATNALKDRFEFLRNNASEDLELLQRQEKLLHVLAPMEAVPSYLDYAA